MTRTIPRAIETAVRRPAMPTDAVAKTLAEILRLRALCAKQRKALEAARPILADMPCLDAMDALALCDAALEGGQ